jgi:hypothetical protein
LPQQLPRGKTLDREGKIVDSEYDEDDEYAPITYTHGKEITNEGEAILSRLDLDLDDWSSHGTVNEWIRRMVTLITFGKTLRDPPVLAFAILMTVTGWRIPFIYHRFKTRNTARRLNAERATEQVRQAKLIKEGAKKEDLPKIIDVSDIPWTVR